MRRAVLAAFATGTVITSALGIGSATPAAMAESLPREEYASALARIEAAHELVLARCDRSTGAAAKEICRAQVDAGEAIRIADLEASYRRTRDAARNAQRAHIEARYLVERAQCLALGGAKRDQCQINAHAARGRALLEAAAPYESRS